jgi:hypothetical protein
VDVHARHALKISGAKLELLWGFTLYHMEDLTFNPKKWFPHTYTAFRKSVEENCRG